MKNFLILILVSMCLFSCNEKQKATNKTTDWSKQHSISYNQEINEREAIQIALFLDHHQEYKMTETETGLRYMIYKDSIGNITPKNGQHVFISLTIKLLDGTECYSTKGDDFEEFSIDKSDEESGLNEAVKFLSVGDKAKLILPSHLAHGLLGDLDKIPPQSILLIDVQLIKIK